MPIIILRSIPPNSGRFIVFVFVAISLIFLVPSVGGTLLYSYVSQWAAYLWIALSLIACVYATVRIDRAVVQLLEWQIDQYSKPIWEKLDALPPARTVFERIARYIVD